VTDHQNILTTIVVSCTFVARPGTETVTVA
jgi:hypothetical protein